MKISAMSLSVAIRQVSFLLQSTVRSDRPGKNFSDRLSRRRFRAAAFSALAILNVAYRFDDPLDEAPELEQHQEPPDHQAETQDERQTCKREQTKAKSEISPENLKYRPSFVSV